MKGKVLIVDDDPIMGNLLEVRLSEAGFEARYFESGEEALDKIHKVKPDIIISDIVMPIMNGYELHRRLRQDEATSGIPFVFLSAKSDKSDQMKGLRMGADDYVCKPFKIEDLIDRMERVMESAAKAKVFHSQADFGDNLSDMKLNEVLQIVELNHKSGELILSHLNGEKLGWILFRNGKLINAEKPPLEGLEAFFELIDEKEGFFEFYGKTTCDEPEKITDTNRSVLLKVSNLIVESKKLYNKIPNPDVVLIRTNSDDFELSRQGVGNRIGKEELKQILSMIDEHRTVQEIIRCGTMSRLRAASILSDLLNVNLIKVQASEADISEERIAHERTERHQTEKTPAVIEEGLVNLLKHCEQDAMTGILKIENIPEKAAIYLYDGSIIHAYYGKTTAKKALYRIFSQKNADYGFHAQPISVYNAIDEPLTFLLEEGAKAIKKFRRIKPGALGRFLSINSQKLKKHPKLRRHRGFNYILSLVRQYGRIGEIVEASQMIDFHTYKNLMFMIRIGVLSFDTKKRFTVQLITDSTADLPSEIIENLNISVIPDTVMLEGKNYRDGIDITPEDFYSLFKNSKILPEFSHPNTEAFHNLFERIVIEKDIVAILQSGKMSRIFENAMAARKENYPHYLRQRQEKYPAEKSLQIELIDSQLISLGTGLLVTEAAEKIEKGWGANTVREYMEKLIPKVRVIFVANKISRSHIRHGVQGNLVRLQLFKLNKFLDIHPIVSLWNGELTIVDQIRGEKNAYRQTIELIKQSMDTPDMPIKVGVMHANVPERAEEMREMLESHLNCQDVIISYMGPGIVAYFGFGSLGIACLPLSEE